MTRKPLLGVDTETRGLGGELLGVCFYGYNSLEYPHCFSRAQAIQDKRFIQRELIDKHTLVFHNAKYDLKILRREGFVLNDYHDTMLMAHLLNPLAPCDLDSVAYRYLGEHKHEIQNKGNLDWTDETIQYCIQDTKLTYLLGKELLDELKKGATHYRWYVENELPYVEVILEMEQLGLVIDRNRTIDAINEYTDKLEGALAEVKSVAPLIPGKEVLYKREVEGFGYFAQKGEIKYNHCQLNEFNPASAHHVIHVLKEQGWEPTKFTPSGEPSTEADVLEELDYPIIKPILIYKDYQKAIGTYLEAFLNYSEPLAGEYAVLHGTFNQAGTITGRLSSSSP